MFSIKKLALFVFTLAISILTSCGGEDGPTTPDPEPILSPEKATLVYPNNNEECTTGNVVSDSETTISFDWEKSENTTIYKIFVRNMSNNQTSSFDASSDKIDLKLTRGIQYSWYVQSKSNKTTDIATSDTWSFYLAGVGTQNYIPFPAELTAPENEAEISTTTVDLSWNGVDLDNDIKEYEVFLDMNNNPTTLKGVVSSMELKNINVSSGNTYYWKIVTTDEIGNASTSSIFSFTVQ